MLPDISIHLFLATIAICKYFCTAGRKRWSKTEEQIMGESSGSGAEDDEATSTLSNLLDTTGYDIRREVFAAIHLIQL